MGKANLRPVREVVDSILDAVRKDPPDNIELRLSFLVETVRRAAYRLGWEDGQQPVRNVLDLARDIPDDVTIAERLGLR